MVKSKAATSSYTLKYDAWNRLVQVFLPLVSTTNAYVQYEYNAYVQYEYNAYVQYEYDGLNRLIVRQADPGADGTIDETRQFYYTQEWQVIEEQVGATASTARPDVQYVWGTQYVDDLVVRYRDADASGSSGSPSLEEELYSLADANFNVTAVTENDGDVVERFTYTPYGTSAVLDGSFSPKASNLSTIAWKYRYTTREFDPMTGKQLNRNRWYDPLLGRWMSRDPIGYWGGMNLYAYVGAMPTKYADPLGLHWAIPPGAPPNWRPGDPVPPGRPSPEGPEGPGGPPWPLPPARNPPGPAWECPADPPPPRCTPDAILACKLKCTAKAAAMSAGCLAFPGPARWPCRAAAAAAGQLCRSLCSAGCP